MPTVVPGDSYQVQRGSATAVKGCSCQLNIPSLSPSLISDESGHGRHKRHEQNNEFTLLFAHWITLNMEPVCFGQRYSTMQYHPSQARPPTKLLDQFVRKPRYKSFAQN